MTLTATSGSINATVDNAASVTATSSRSFNSTSINLSSNTVLNASSITATATDCLSSTSCPGATINLTGALGVNVGTVTANAPVTFRFNRTAEYQSRSRSIDINGGNGPINAIGAGSQITATDVTLRTTAGGGGGIGVAGTPVRVDVERSFTFRPNGGFDVLLNGSGPIVFDARLGVAATGGTYSGVLSKPGAITLNASATDTTVTVSNFSVVAGFDRPVYSSTPSIALSTPNGALTVTSAAMPAGDNAGFALCPPGFGDCSESSLVALPVSFSARGALTVTSYTRAAGASGQSTTFTAGDGGNGALLLGTINGNGDSITANGDDSVTVNDLSTLGIVTVGATAGSTASGNVTIGRIVSGPGNVTVTATNGTIAALTDGVANEITSGGTVTLSGASIGTSVPAPFGNPFDIAGNEVSLTASGTAVGTGYIGSGAVPTNPVVAATQRLTVNASRQFNVDTGTVPVVDLTVTATPAGVGASGLAQVRSDGQPFVFGTDGSKFTLNNMATTTQLNGGTLSFTATAGNIEFGNIDFSATNGSLTLRTRQNATGDVTRIAGPFSLGSGLLTVQADRDVNLGDLTVGGLSVSSVNGSVPGPGACEFIGGSFRCATNSLTVGDVTGGGFGGSFTATTRRAISAGDMDGVGGVNFTAYSGGISTGVIGSAATPASSITLRTDLTSAGGNITTGAIDSNSILLRAFGTATTGALNAAATSGGSSTEVSATGALNTGTINAAATAPGEVLLRSNTSVTAGTIATSDLTVGLYTTASSPTLNLGAISGPTRVDLRGGSVTLGTIAMDAANPGTLSINAAGTLTLGGAITAGDSTNATITAGNTGPLLFSRIVAGDNGRVSISSANGIEQTQTAAAGGGIRAGRVLLSASGGSGSILGPGADNARLTLRNTTNLTLVIGDDSRLSLVDGAGSAPGPELVNLDITRNRNDSTFVLDGLSPSQTLALLDTGGGTRITLDSSGSAAPINFRYRNQDTAGVIEVTSISSNGGSVALEAPNGDVRVTTINASGPGTDRQVSISAGGRVDVAGVIDGGDSPVNISAAQQVRRTAVGGEVRSNTSVSVTAAGANAIGASPTNERFRVTAPAVNLDGGEIYADLTGTTDLTLQVTNGLSVASSTGLTSLRLSIDATGTGPTTINGPSQTYGLARNAGELEIGTIATGTPLDILEVTTTAGGMQVIGSGSPSISASSLRLESAGRLYLDGLGARLELSNANQQFLASGELRIEGQASISAADTQSFTTFGANDIVFAASGGALEAVAAVQTLNAGRDIQLLAGAGSNESVTLSVTEATQTLTAGGSILLTAGAGAGSRVNVESDGTGRQTLQASTSIVLTGGGTLGGSEAASVSVLQTGSGGQRLQARTSVVLTGGAGDDGVVLVHNSGPGTQNIGDPFTCCNFYRTDTVSLLGGSGSRSAVELRSTGGQQRVEPINALNVTGGTGSDAHARIASTSASEQVIGGPSYICCNFDPINTIAIAAGSGTNAFAEITAVGTQRVTSATSLAMTGSAAVGGYALISGAGQDIRTAATSLVAGTGGGADAQILSTGSASQFIDPTSLTMTAGGLAGTSSASVRIVSGGTQTFGSTNPTTLTGGAGSNSVAEIRSAGNQILNLGNLTLTGGADVQSWAKITSGGSQSLNAGTTLLTGGTAAGTFALIEAAGNQTVNAGNTTLIGRTGTAGAGNDAGARITNASGNQAISTGALTIRSGADHAQSGIINTGANQTINAGSIQVGTSAGANTVDSPIASTFHAAIAQQGSGGQTVNASALTIDNAHSAGSVGVVNRGAGVQTVTVSGALNVLASGGGGTATLDSGNSGMQTVTANGGIIVRASSGGGLAQIANPQGSQTFASSGGGVVVQATGGSGIAKISAADAQTLTAVRSLEVSTTASATGNAELVAGGNQSIHTTNGISAGHSLKVVALGTGTARIEAGGNQLIEADYPELMQGVRDGRILIGAGAALGPSLIKGVNQDIFARSIIIQGGATSAATAKLDSSGNQTISILTPSAIPAGITVAGGAGGSASLDPLVQTILSTGPIQVLGGSGPDTFALIQSFGPQTILVTGSETVNSVLIQGGSGSNAYAAITTPDPQMALGTSGGISLVGGSGSNTDAVFGNGAINIVNFSCGPAFTCTFTNLVSDPFLNPGIDVGIANNGVLVPLANILAPSGGPAAQAPGGSALLPFDFGNLLLALRDQSDQTLEGDAGQELLLVLLGRRLPLCR